MKQDIIAQPGYHLLRRAHIDQDGLPPEHPPQGFLVRILYSAHPITSVLP
jgi:hypothetical protein